MNANSLMMKVDEQKGNWENSFEKEVSFAPLVDIIETENDFVLVANMPGVARENIRIKFEDRALIIMGKVNIDELVKKTFVLNETIIGNYYRKLRLSNSIDENKISAKYENGQLIINLPKHERIKPRVIDIN
ncbi:MAG: heat-shock protein Hsp20 [Chlorobiaceae bacterium]|nr:heat-shock protein Hsp20 [Chlorobiaceae bacterium]MBA4309355.1 heat-shock protein Hsp20 [Chlorobiaceae bacterium]